MKHSQWEESQKEMLSKLVTSGANKIWEHSLHDPVVKSNPKKYVQKPIYTDSLDDKRSYIRVSKHIAIIKLVDKKRNHKCFLEKSRC